MKVICINTQNLPEGAILEEDREYKVVKEFVNSYDEKTYILYNHINEGITRLGMRWIGYKASRFHILENTPQYQNQKEELILN